MWVNGMKFGTVLPGRYTGADRYAGVAVGRRSTVFRFPVGVLHYLAGVRPTCLPIRLAGMEEMSLVWGNESGCVPTNHSWNT